MAGSSATVEVHSTWGTFEWLLHDAFALGFRVGVVCHSDDHKGRPGATRPGASSFGAIGGLTCYLMPELTRDALFDALRRRRHYGTTGARIFLDLRGSFDTAVTALSDDPLLGPRRRAGPRGADGRHHPARLRADAAHRRSHRHRADRADRRASRHASRGDLRPTLQPISGGACACSGRAPNIAAAGARRSGKARSKIAGNRIARFAPVNFLNPERKVLETEAGTALAWSSVTTGNLAGIDLWLDHARAGSLSIETNVVSGDVDLATLDDGTIAFDGGGLGRQLSVYRLPETDWSRSLKLTHDVTFPGGADLPVYLRVTQADGNQAWSSPIYLIA